MNKRDQVERAVNVVVSDWLDRPCSSNLADTLRVNGFTICGPDEVPMPKDANVLPLNAGGIATYLVCRDRYQRQRNGEGGDATGESNG